jgi:hypothetical protein
MSGRVKHALRSKRSHKNTIPRFQEFNSRAMINQTFSRDKMTFGQHMALLFSLFRSRKGR